MQQEMVVCLQMVGSANNWGVNGAIKVSKTIVQQIAEGIGCIANSKSSKVWA